MLITVRIYYNRFCKSIVRAQYHKELYPVSSVAITTNLGLDRAEYYYSALLTVPPTRE